MNKKVYIETIPKEKYILDISDFKICLYNIYSYLNVLFVCLYNDEQTIK